MKKFCLIAVLAAAFGVSGEQVLMNPHDYALVRAALRARDGRENVLVSPHSARSAFAMLYDGARGDTADELARAFGFDYRPGMAKREESPLPEVSPDIAVKSANSVWIDRGADVLPGYRSAVSRRHGAGECFVENFRRSPEDAALRINGWIDAVTAGKIGRMLEPGNVRNAEIVLINALYFKGKWLRAFPREATGPVLFRRGDGKNDTVPMMRLTGEFSWFKNKSARGVLLPYRNERFALLCVLPASSAPGALAELEKELDNHPGFLPDALRDIHSAEVVVQLPRFRLEDRRELEPLMRSLAVREVFTRRANLSGINGRHNLYVSQALHQAVFETDEAGSEGAAATALAVKRMALVRPEVFRADRPFLIFLLDRENGSILFGGRVAVPGR